MACRPPGRGARLAALLALLAVAAAQAPSPAPAPASPSAESEPPTRAPLPTAVPGGFGNDGSAAILGWGSLSSLSAGSSGPCGIYERQSSAAMCWGRQVGASPTQLANFSVPTAVDGGGSWNALAAGSYVNSSTKDEDAFACGIRADGSLACWGTDSSGLGLLGAGDAGLNGSVSPLPLAEPGPWSSVSAGIGFSCAIKSDDQSAWCWGHNSVGQLGCGSIGDSHTATPCRVASGERWLRIVAGDTTACGISAANLGSLWCWGDLNMSDPFPSPIRVMDSGVAAVSIGGNDTCIILRNQTGACFPTGVWPPRMALIPGNRRWTQLSVGNGHMCGRTVSNDVLCWGDNSAGQCGTGTENALVAEPTPVDLSSVNQDGDSFIQVEAGDRFTCILSQQGAPYCFGDGSYGQLGDGLFSSSGVPVLVSNPAPAPPAPPASPPPPPLPSPPSPPIIVSESSTPVGAIVGGVVGGVAALAAAAAGLLWLRRRRRRAAAGAVPHGTSKGALHSGSSNGKGGGGGDAAVEELHIMQQKGLAASHRASGSSIPAGWSNEFVRSDQLLSWIVAHVTPSPGSASTLRSGGSNATAATVAPTTPPAAVALGAPSFGAPLSRHRHSSSSDVHSPRIADIQPFELNFWDLTMERSIGRGSFGKVYLASWHETPVAVKLLMQLDGTHQPSCGGTPGPSAEDSGSGPPADEEAAVTLSSPAMARFYKEAQLMAAMRHPNVISLLGFCVKPPALVTEYCARGSLTDVLREAATDGEKAARLTWQLRLHMALDAAKGMLALHSHSPVVLHRDLKGPNLLVDFSWRVKVTDFGLSKIVEEGLSMQSTQSPVNPRWLAPEILAGARATTASDVFSYGVILYELLTWTVPWGGADFWEIVSALTRGERLPIPDRASLPGPDTLRFAGLAGYIVLMQRCWAQEPTQRPDFEEIVQCLRRLLEEAPA